MYMVLMDLLHCERVRKKKEVETPMGKPGASTGMSLRLASQALIQSELNHQQEEKEQRQVELSRTSSNPPANEKSAEKKNDAENEENVNTSANREDEVIESLDAVLDNDQDHVQGDALPGNMDDSGSCGSVSGSGQKVQMQMSEMSPSAAFKLDFAIEETLEAGQKILAEFSQDMSLLNESWVNSPVVHHMIPHREGESPDFAREDTSNTPTHNVRVPHRAPPKTPGQPSPELQTSRIGAVSVSAGNETNETKTETKTKTRNKQVIVSEQKDEIERERLWEVQTQTRQLWQADRQLRQKANSFFSTTLYSARMLKVVEALKKQKQIQPTIDQKKEDRMQIPQKVQDTDIETEPELETEKEKEKESNGSSKKVTPNKSSPWFVAATKSLSPEKCHPADATLSAWDPVVQHVLKGAATSPHRQKEQKERKVQANYHRPLSYDWLHIPGGGLGEHRASPKAATLTLLELIETPPQQFSQVSAAHSWLEARLHGIIDSLHGQLTEVVIPALKAELWSADMQSRMAPFLRRLQAVLSVCYEVWSFLTPQQPPATTTTTVELQFPWKWCQSWQGLWIHLGIWSLHCQNWSIYLMEWERCQSFDRRQRLRQLLGEFAPGEVHALWQWSMIPLLLLEQLPLFWEAYSHIALLPVTSLVPVGRLVASSQRWQSAFAPSLRQQTSLLKMSALLPPLRVPTQLLSLYPSLQSSWPPILVCQVSWENAPEDQLPVAKGDTLRLIAHLQEGILGLAVPLPLNRDSAMERDHPDGDSHGDDGDKSWEWVAIAHVGKDNNSMEKWPMQVGENPWQLILLPQRWRTVRAEINGHLQPFDGRDNNAREKAVQVQVQVQVQLEDKSNANVRRDGYLPASVLGELAPLSAPDWLQACEEWYEAKAAVQSAANLSWPSGYETWQQWDKGEDPRLWEGLPQIPAFQKGEATPLAPLVPLVAESPPLTITPPLCYQGLRQLQHLVDLALTQHPSHSACQALAQTLQTAEERWKKDTATNIDNNQMDEKDEKENENENENEKEKLLPEMVPVQEPDHHPSLQHLPQPSKGVVPQPQTQTQLQTQPQPVIVVKRVESSIAGTMPQQRENEKKMQEEDAKGDDLVFVPVPVSDGQTDTVVGQGDIAPLPPTTWQSIRTASRHRKQQAAALEEEEEQAQAQTTENRQSNHNDMMERMRARPLVEGRGRTRTLVAYALPLPPEKNALGGHSPDTHQVTPPQTLEQRFSLSIAAGLPPKSSQHQHQSKSKNKSKPKRGGGAQRPLMTQHQRNSPLDNDNDNDTDNADSNSALVLSRRGDDDSRKVRERERGKVEEEEEEEVSHGSGSERMLPSEGASFISSDDADESSESESPMAAPAKPAPLPPSSHPVVPVPLTRPPPPPPDDDDDDDDDDEEEDLSF
jgi:hypothetical protein